MELTTILFIANAYLLITCIYQIVRIKERDLAIAELRKYIDELSKRSK